MPRKLWSKTVTVFVAGCLVLSPLHEAIAHGGGTDRYGCHRETQTGTRHCHEKKEEKEDIPWAIIGGVAGGLLVLGLVAKWLKDDETPPTVQLVPYLDEKHGQSVAAEFTLDDMQRLGIRTTTGVAGQDRESAYIGAYWRLSF